MSETKVRIQDDLYEAVNGEWLKTAVIPEDRPTTGGFSDLDQGVEKIMMADFAAFAAGETDYVPTVWECLSYGYMDLPANPGYLVDLLLSLAMGGLGCWGYVTRSLRMEEEAAARRAEQERTAELARLQTEQAARAAELNGERDPSAPAPEDTEASDSEAADPSDASSSAPSDTEEA